MIVMIEVEHLSKSFNDKLAVDDISFKVKEGENLVLVGTSGCGKTTTLRMINRLTEPGSGTVRIAGKDNRSGSSHLLRRGIGYVLQHHGLFPHYTVEENIAVVPKLLGWHPVKIKQRTTHLMEQLHLSPGQYLKAYPSELSGGQQQRVGLARALVADPPVILMDEPFGALDEVTRSSIRKEFAELEEFKRKTMVMVTHDIGEAFELGDNICLMNQGRIVQQGSRFDLLFKPANEFVRKFLARHYFELQLRMTVIKELWDYLPDRSTSNKQFPEKYEHNLSLWQSMELLFQNDNASGHLQFEDPDSGVQKTVNMQALASAFQQFKNK